jgi:hypothetical protein
LNDCSDMGSSRGRKTTLHSTIAGGQGFVRTVRPPAIVLLAPVARQQLP